MELQIKYRALLNVQHGSLIRGDNGRTAHLCHCGIIDVPSLSVGARKVKALRIILNHGKTNSVSLSVQSGSAGLPLSSVDWPCGHQDNRFCADSIPWFFGVEMRTVGKSVLGILKLIVAGQRVCHVPK